MHHLTFLQDLAIVMCVAALATILFRQFKQPVVLGYIVAGVLIGPHTPPVSLIANEGTIETLAELGVIFLMFALGLEFSFRKLQKVGVTAFIAASLEILLMIAAGYGLGKAFGWSEMDSIFLGAILSISSTTIIIKALEGLGKKNEGFASIIIGILIVEDILAIVMIALLSGFATTGQFAVQDVGMTILGLGAFLGILLVVGLIAVPRLLNYVAKFKSDEMLLVTVVGLCFGVSLITVKLGYSVALGAFLIGAIIAESRHIFRIETLMLPVRDLFSAVFFVSIGLLIDPQLILKYIWPILAITSVVVVGKVLACSLGCLVAGHDTRTSMKVGMGLAQIGEFSFIIASLGLSLKVTSDFVYPIAVAVSALTTLFTPYLINMSDGVVSLVERIAPKPVLRGLENYTHWVGSNRENTSNAGFERKILTKLALQIGFNMLLVTGIFIGAVFVHSKYGHTLPVLPGGKNGLKAAFWLAAMLISFPLLVAVWRKLEASAMVISEMSVNPEKAGDKTFALQNLITKVITFVGTAVLVLVVLLLSSTILPTWNVLILVALIAAVVGFLLYRGSVKVYASAQSAIRETFEETALPHPMHGGPPPEQAQMLPPLLREAKLESVKLDPNSTAVGKLIAELQLRTETGASVVGIDRQGTSIINPGPNEELSAGDEILLLGSTIQLEAAKVLFAKTEAA